jgi:tetratricopeptide (TPR) repeat protein
MATTEEIWEQARAQHLRGNWAEAEQLYRQVLDMEPSNAGAVFMLGVTCHQQQRSGEAVALYRFALKLQPALAEAHQNLGVALAQQGNPAEAIACYRQALQHKPNYPEAFHNLGVALEATKQTAEAVACFEKALQLKPDYGSAHMHLTKLRGQGSRGGEQGSGDRGAGTAPMPDPQLLTPGTWETLNAMGNRLASQGKLAEAVRHYEQALRLKPDSALTQNNLGNACWQQGKLDEAIAWYRRAVQSQSDFAEAHNNLGNALNDRGRPEEAAASCREAVRLRPDYALGHNNLGNALRRLGRGDEAIASYREALRLQPNFAEAHSNLGSVLRDQKRLEEALACCQTAVRLKPAYALAHNDLGNVLADRGRLEEAIACYRQALRLRPNMAHAYNNLGVALFDSGKIEEAAGNYREALRLRPGFPEAHNNMGNALKSMGKLDEAVNCYRQAIRFRPNYGEAYNNLGVTFKELDQMDEGVACYRQALKLKPDYPEAHLNLGAALVEQGKLAEGMACFEDALHLDPGYPDGHWNRALVWLLEGNYQQGWPEYEWRWQRKGVQPLPAPQPRWDGTSLAGKTILLLSEQGLGDTLQFIRYVPLVRERAPGGSQPPVVVLETQKRLAPLLAGYPGIDRVIAQGEPRPEFDVYAPLMSLPALFGTDAATIPAGVPYLGADAERIAAWRRRLADMPGFKIGIAWQGNPKYKWDKQRSVPLTQFAPLAKLEGVQLISLQKGPGTEQLGGQESGVTDQASGGRQPPVSPTPDPRPLIPFPVTDLGESLDQDGAFVDTAAIMKSLDLVVITDSAIAHLAGALGVKVWMILGLVPDWRWLMGREDCPWYPTMRIFRQEKRGDWESVFERVAAEVRACVGFNPTPTLTPTPTHTPSSKPFDSREGLEGEKEQEYEQE